MKRNIIWPARIIQTRVYIFYGLGLDACVITYKQIMLKLTCAAEINKMGSRLTSSYICSSVSMIHLKNKKKLSEGFSNLCL
jgi:hypothetical protein